MSVDTIVCCRLLNPMYEGFLQHDAQEVLQCILGYMQEACDTIRKEQESKPAEGDAEIKQESGGPAAECNPGSEEENQVSGKRKSDTEVGNAKKKPKSVTSKKPEDSKDEPRSQPLTRSKRRSSSDGVKGKEGETDDKEIKKLHKEEDDEGGAGEEKGSEDTGKKAAKEAEGKNKKKTRLRWLRPSGKQPSIFSKFRSMGKISSTTPRNPSRAEEEEQEAEEKKGLNAAEEERSPEKLAEDEKAAKLLGGTLMLLELKFTFTPQFNFNSFPELPEISFLILQ